MSHDHERGPHGGPGPRGGPGPHGGPGDHRGGPGGDRGGPPGTSFLHLEMSRVLYSDATELAKDACRSIMRDAIAARLRERLGDRLEAIARLAADDLADDVLANLDIEARVGERRRAHGDLAARLADALRGAGSPAPSDAPSGEDRKK